MPTGFKELNPGKKILLGPGPSNVHPRVLQAMATPLISHLNPDFLKIMDQVQEMLRALFQTSNKVTLPISGTGSAGMEACLCNMIEPDDKVLICVNGFFGQRMCDMVERMGGVLKSIEVNWGEVFDPQQVEKAIKEFHPQIVGIVHAETSTGALQPLKEMSEIVHEAGAILIVDTVTSLGGCPVEVDEWQLNVTYSGTQKCIGCPPGLAPLSFNEAAMNKLSNRKKKGQSFYFDVALITRYWDSERVFHHTAPISMIYALHEALRRVHEEGLENRFRRHKANHEALVAGIEAMGIKMFVPKENRLWTLNAVTIPEGIDDKKIRGKLLTDYNIEIGGGFGPLAGKIWRIGLMGESSSRANVLMFLSALEDTLSGEGVKIDRGAAVATAQAAYNRGGD